MSLPEAPAALGMTASALHLQCESWEMQERRMHASSLARQLHNAAAHLHRAAEEQKESRGGVAASVLAQMGADVDQELLTLGGMPLDALSPVSALECLQATASCGIQGR